MHLSRITAHDKPKLGLEYSVGAYDGSQESNDSFYGGIWPLLLLLARLLRIPQFCKQSTENSCEFDLLRGELLGHVAVELPYIAS